jgi:ubiquinone/menaquinone biosynthesis C-methylase UbiE
LAGWALFSARGPETTLKKIVEDMQVYYGRRAAVYDSSMGYDKPETIKLMTPVIEFLKKLMKGRRVLEIACGPCFWTKFISKAAVSLLATDFNQAVLDEARRKDLDWRKVTLLQADAYDLSTISQKFDGAVAVDWLAHVPRSRIHSFLRNLHETLEDKAQIAFCDQLPRDNSITGDYDEEGNHLQERVLPDGTRFKVIKHFLSDEDINAIFSPYSDKVEVSRFRECRRIVVSYQL